MFLETSKLSKSEIFFINHIAGMNEVFIEIIRNMYENVYFFRIRIGHFLEFENVYFLELENV